MKIGFLTHVLSELPLDQVVRWAGRNGFGALEIACEVLADQPAMLNGALNVARLEEEGARSLRNLAAEAGVVISCLTRCLNMLDADPACRQANMDEARRVLDAAAMLNVGVVSNFVGRDLTRPIEANLPLFEEVFQPLVSDAAARGVRIAIENCPLIGGPAGDQVQNIAIAPAVWRRMFEAIPDLGLNFDPSHLYWMGVDYLAAVREFGRHVFHVHLKDTEVLDEALADGGILTMRPRWWRFRIPGFGRIDWAAFVSALIEAKYDGALSIEHEDPVFRGDLTRKQHGLLIGHKRIEALLP
jgi:sugar phosphate isomerase/epimerase